MAKKRKIPAVTAASGAYRQRYGEHTLGVARPRNLDELREIVLEAGRSGFTLHLHGFGIDTPQSFENVVIVDLKDMNRIVEVNKTSAYALLEPGVTYEQLYRHLEDNNTGLWIDSDRNQLNSVAASISAHEYGYTPYGDHMMMQCGMEVMLSNGELTRIGMGALPGSNTWQLAKYAYGPYVDGLFTQSNFGIITKVGVWLMPAPPAYRPFMLSLANADDIAAAVEVLRPLKINVIVPNSVVISNALLDAAPFSRREDFLHEGKADIEAIKARHKLGAWNLYGALYNTPDNVEVLWPMVSAALGGIAEAKLYTAADRKDDVIWQHREALMRGRPVANFDKIEYWQGEYRCDIALACPLNGEDILHLNRIVAATLEKYGFEDLSECIAGWRSIIKRNYIVFNDDASADAEKCVNEVIKNAGAKGFGLTQCKTTHPQVNIQSSPNEGMQILQQRLKSALDPQVLLV